MEIAGPRMHVTPVDGMPLLRLSRPRFTGASRVLKVVMDRAGATLMLLITAPVLAAVAIAVLVTDGRPVFFVQDRVGYGGRAFRMVKFRSMTVGADRDTRVLAGTHDGAGPLFKLRQDPRVTPVGRMLRRFSLDELPQLFNVLVGSMSLSWEESVCLDLRYVENWSLVLDLVVLWRTVGAVLWSRGTY